MIPIHLVANGDLRIEANQKCEAAQAAMEKQLIAAVEKEGTSVKRAHPFDPEKKHGFIDSQKYGMQVFKTIPAEAPLIVAESVWQVQSPSPARPRLPSWTDLDRGKLERNMARPGWPPEP